MCVENWNWYVSWNDNKHFSRTIRFSTSSSFLKAGLLLPTCLVIHCTYSSSMQAARVLKSCREVPRPFFQSPHYPRRKIHKVRLLPLLAPDTRCSMIHTTRQNFLQFQGLETDSSTCFNCIRLIGERTLTFWKWIGCISDQEMDWFLSLEWKKSNTRWERQR